jgi:hypothetical protein
MFLWYTGVRGATMKNILYGVSNFADIIADNGYYIDKTSFIEKLEQPTYKFAFFFRPRRFGKSLFLSTLEHYYDINRKADFEKLFKGLYIGENPTPLRNSYPILKFDFSVVSSYGTIEQTSNSFFTHIRSRINSFFRRYGKRLNIENIFLQPENVSKTPEDMFGEFIDYLNDLNIKLYLIIDEYDNFANNILAQHGEDTYYSITHGTGFFRAFFNVLKVGTTSCIDRIFATGVTPLVLSDVTSGFNIGTNISVNPDFHELAGFNEADVKEIVDYHIKQGLISETVEESLLYTMKKYYDGYLFSPKSKESLYNSTAIWYLISPYRTLSDETQKNELPRRIIDSNLMTDYKKLEFLVIEKQKLNGNYKELSEILLTGQCEDELVDTFSVKELNKSSHFTSFLYYLGLITIKEENFLNTVFTIPNEACRYMLWEYIRTALDSVLGLDFSRQLSLFTDFAVKGKWKQYFEAIFEQAYHVTSNRDFKYGESVIKGIILGYMTNTNLYLIQSERELDKCYTDLYLEPMLWLYPKMSEMRYLIELKYLKSEEIAEDKIDKHVAKAKAAAITQLDQYSKRLNLAQVPVTKLVIIASSKELLLLEEIAI